MSGGGRNNTNAMKKFSMLLASLQNYNHYDEDVDYLKLQLLKILTEVDSTELLRWAVEEIYSKVMNLLSRTRVMRLTHCTTQPCNVNAESLSMKCTVKSLKTIIKVSLYTLLMLGNLGFYYHFEYFLLRVLNTQLLTYQLLCHFSEYICEVCYIHFVQM